MPTAPSKPAARKAPSRRLATAPATDTEAIVALDPDTVEFDVQFLDLDEEPAESHTFRARPHFGYKRMREAALAQQRGGMDAVMRFEKMIVPSLVDDDGTPAQWAPEVEDGEFVDPDGDTRPVADLPQVLDPANGSSRRRWGHLMDARDDLSIDIGEIVRVYELLVEKSSSRPTQRSKSS